MRARRHAHDGQPSSARRHNEQRTIDNNTRTEARDGLCAWLLGRRAWVQQTAICTRATPPHPRTGPSSSVPCLVPTTSPTVQVEHKRPLFDLTTPCFPIHHSGSISTLAFHVPRRPTPLAAQHRAARISVSKESILLPIAQDKLLPTLLPDRSALEPLQVTQVTHPFTPAAANLGEFQRPVTYPQQPFLAHLLPCQHVRFLFPPTTQWCLTVAFHGRSSHWQVFQSHWLRQRLSLLPRWHVQQGHSIRTDASQGPAAAARKSVGRRLQPPKPQHGRHEWRR